MSRPADRKPVSSDLTQDQTPKKKKRGFDLIRFLVLLLCIGVFSFSAYEVLTTLSSYREGRAFYNSTAERYVRESEEPDSAEPENPPEFSDVSWENGSETEADPDSPLEILKHATVPISVDFDELLAECKDVVAWVYSPDTVISYPIVQAEDNEYYLRRRLDGNYSGNGTVFMDFRCEPDFTSDNSLIYGHNMRDGSMFHSLRDYSDPEYYAAHPYLFLLTPAQNYVIRLFYGGIVSSTGWPYNVVFADDAERSSFLRQAAETSDFDAGFSPEEDDRIITLSTCSYEFSDARYVVIGTLVPIE